MLERMTKLGQVEETVRGQSPNAHVGAPWVAGNSNLAQKLRDTILRRAIFERFLTEGRVQLDSNIVERAIRPQTTTKKNSLFARSEGGGRTWATIATLLRTAKMNNVDPLAWLAQ